MQKYAIPSIILSNFCYLAASQQPEDVNNMPKLETFNSSCSCVRKRIYSYAKGNYFMKLLEKLFVIILVTYLHHCLNGTLFSCHFIIICDKFISLLNVLFFLELIENMTRFDDVENRDTEGKF